MSYTAEINRTNPTCFLFMIDQSRSMTEVIAGGSDQKAVGVADAINHWLLELSMKCAKSNGVNDYYHVGVIGYGNSVGPAFVGDMAGRELIPISEIAENPARVEKRKVTRPDEKGRPKKQSVKLPIWFDPVADGATPMCSATAEAHRILQGWLGQHGDCYPPQVIHITDGEATDGNPEERVRALTRLASSDGGIMLFNIHLSSNPKAKPIVFPDTPDGLPDAYSRMLFDTASLLTPNMRSVAAELGYATSENSKAFVLNSDVVSLVQAIDIGTRPAIVLVDASPADDFEPDGTPYSAGDDAFAAAAAREQAAMAGTQEEVAYAEDTGGYEGGACLSTQLEMTVLQTGARVEADIYTDEAGRIIQVVPTQPLDGNTYYRVGPQER